MNRPLGRGGGGQVVCVLALYSDDPSFNPADAFEMNKNKQKRGRGWPFFKKDVNRRKNCTSHCIQPNRKEKRSARVNHHGQE